MTLTASAIAGASWVLSFSTFNVVVQMSSPRWVVGRTLALYQTAAFGGAAIGAWAWGVTAERFGLTQSLLAASVVLAATCVWLGGIRPLAIQVTEDLAPASIATGGPSLTVPASVGPIIISVEYRVKPEEVPEFLRAAHELGRTRRRDGARRWSMMQDLDDPSRFVERYQALTWLDHLRQWQRATAADQGVRDRVLALHQGPQPPVVRHLWVREPDEFDPLPGARPD
jgi:quinol monooxygenase YgiN